MFTHPFPAILTQDAVAARTAPKHAHEQLAIAQPLRAPGTADPTNPASARSEQPGGIIEHGRSAPMIQHAESH
ncbi:hypothetical protein AB0N93_36750 [Streptomyces sp. NPDC091267]|uniref:hypothetical protein n=1 Tax=Streptomyces sp. NPDC091267 TaxID=3155195 RepID=UPI00341A3EBC